MDKLKNAIGYVRVSTEAQAEDDTYGVELQKKAIEEYAKENGYNIIDWRIDEMSGAKDDRPELNEILYGETYNPPVEAVIVFKNDRMARDTKLYFYYLYALEKKNIKLLSTEENFAEGNEFVNIYRSLMMFVAEQERKNIALRTSKGRNLKASVGGYAGGRPPYGYEADNGKLKVKEDEIELIRMIFALKKEGKTMQHICEILTDNGYRTRTGRWFLPSTLQGIYKNEEFYKGNYKYGKEGSWVKGVHEPIL